MSVLLSIVGQRWLVFRSGGSVAVALDAVHNDDDEQAHTLDALDSGIAEVAVFVNQRPTAQELATGLAAGAELIQHPNCVRTHRPAVDA